MVDVVFQGAWVLYRFKKDEGDESLSFLVFRRHIVNAVFLKYSKEGRLSSSHVGTRNILQIFVMMTQNITRCNMNTSVLRTPSSIKDEVFLYKQSTS